MTLQPVTLRSALSEFSRPEGLGGLIALVEGVECALPLTEVVVRTRIVGDCARTVVEQRFTNAHDSPLEAVHIFPLPEDGAVVEVVLKAGEVEVRAACQEKEAAERAFSEARAQGHRAALLTQERDDVHTLRVTRIPPGEEVRVQIVVVERLQRVDGQMRWRFPTTIAPRYLVGEPVGHDGAGVLPSTDRVPDADRLQPPLRLTGGTLLDLEVEIEGPVRGLQCAQHAFRVDLDGCVRVAPASDTTLDRDFVLSFSTAEADSLATRAWTDGSHTLVTIEAPAVAMPDTLPRDAVFLVDISGSMQGVKLEAAKRAMVAAVHGLSAGDRFRIVAFDDRVEPMSPDLLPYDAASLERADAFIESLRSRGGTEMLPAIVEGLAGDRPDGRARSVLFITDGQAWNEAELTAAVSNRCKGARFFTFGIDTAVNSALLSRLARVGGGTCELATPSDDIEEALANLEARFGNPVLDGVHLEGGISAALGRAAVFTGRSASLMLEGAPGSVTVVATGAEGEVRIPVKPVSTTMPLGALWARERVAALQDRLLLKPFEEEALRPEIVRIALAHGIASRFTAFVAVDQSQVVLGALHEQVQPAEASARWDMPMGAAPPSPAKPTRSPAPSKRRRSRKASLMRGGPVRAADFAEMAAFDMDEEPCSGAEPPAESAPWDAPEDVGGSRIIDSVTYGERASKRAQKAESALVAKEDRFGGPGSAAPPNAGDLARTQQADGSFGGSIERTVAALLTLLLLGHTRRTGARRRTVAKAASWLQQQSGPLAASALAWLARAEAGETLQPEAGWAALYLAGSEGVALRTATGL